MNIFEVFSRCRKNEASPRSQIFNVHKRFECASFAKIRSTISFLVVAKFGWTNKKKLCFLFKTSRRSVLIEIKSQKKKATTVFLREILRKILRKSLRNNFFFSVIVLNPLDWLKKMKGSCSVIQVFSISRLFLS